jgi:hypothetical protein
MFNWIKKSIKEKLKLKFMRSENEKYISSAAGSAPTLSFVRGDGTRQHSERSAKLN